VSDPKKVQGAANLPTRREERIFTTEPAELANLDKRRITESTSTQNISSHGARVSTQCVWEPGSFLLIKSLRSSFSARARVVYWRSFSSSRFTIGLEFVTQEGDWPPSN
jgi:hypothetical protein